MNWLESVILGLIQGLTEFLPVSSSGHLMIFRELLGVDFPADGDKTFMSFEIIVHAATVCATIVVFRKEILDLLRGLFKFKYNSQTEYILKICISMIPVFIVGMFFKDRVEALFGGLSVVGISLIFTALLLFFSDILSSKIKEGKDDVSYSQAFIIGLAQAVAVIPGLSRSGATISAGLLCGSKRSAVAQFSFLMVLVPILGKCFLSLLDGGFTQSVQAIGVLPLCLGFLTAFAAGLLSCKAMIKLVQRASLKWFALYCVIIGTATTIASFI